MTEQQIPKLVALLVEHQNAFSQITVEDGQWVIQNTVEAIELFVVAVASRAKQVAEKVAEKLLDWIGTITVSATTFKFIARDKFVVNTSDSAEVKISYLGENFKRWFLGKIEGPITEQTLRYAKLRMNSKDPGIITELGGDAKAETTLTEMFAVLKRQGHGTSGVLLTNGWANISYVCDQGGVLRTVDAYWYGGGWNVNASGVSNPHAWSEGSQVFSRKLLET